MYFMSILKCKKQNLTKKSADCIHYLCGALGMVKFHYLLIVSTTTTLLSDMLYEPLINNCTKYDALQNAISNLTRLSNCECLRLDSLQPFHSGWELKTCFIQQQQKR